MKKILLFLGVAFVTSCVHLFLGIIGTQHASIRFMVRDKLSAPSENGEWARHTRDEFIQAEELKDCPRKIQEKYREAILDARNAIAASRRANLFLAGVSGCLLLGAGVCVAIMTSRKKSNKRIEGTAV